jgi:hypothetical protein
VSEAELQKAVIDLARRLGWRTAHFRTSRTQSGGWATAVQGDGKGFPDLVMVGDRRVLFVELKAKGKHPTIEQRDWLDRLTDAPGVETYVWRPTDWTNGTIEQTLRDPISVAA